MKRNHVLKRQLEGEKRNVYLIELPFPPEQVLPIQPPISDYAQYILCSLYNFVMVNVESELEEEERRGLEEFLFRIHLQLIQHAIAEAGVIMRTPTTAFKLPGVASSATAEEDATRIPHWEDMVKGPCGGPVGQRLRILQHQACADSAKQEGSEDIN